MNGEEMSDLLIAAPLRVEALLVASVARGARVCRTGIGYERSKAAARALREHPATAVVVVGFCGGLEESSTPGDVVVADELIPPDEVVQGLGVRRGQVIECSGAEALVRMLGDRGLEVRRGAIASVLRPAIGSERAELRDRGAIAVDMESAFLARGVGERPFAVVRVVVDTPARELRRPLATLTGGARAARSLRRVAGALHEWVPED